MELHHSANQRPRRGTGEQSEGEDIHPSIPEDIDNTVKCVTHHYYQISEDLLNVYGAVLLIGYVGCTLLAVLPQLPVLGGRLGEFQGLCWLDMVQK